MLNLADLMAQTLVSVRQTQVSAPRKTQQQMNFLRVSCMLLALAALLHAEQGGFLTGIIHDHSGAVIAGAELRIQNAQTGARQKIYADSSGAYATTALAPGPYKITVRSDGFRTASRDDIAVTAAKTTRADFTIELLPLQQEVTVTAAQSHDDPMVSGVTVSRDSPSGSLPANGRDIHALFSLMPGATVTPASLTSGGQFTVGGQRPNANSFRVDGVSGNVGIGIISVPGAFPGGSLPGMTTVGGTQTLASKEETERVELRSADFSAEYGDRPGAQIDIETRSGTNDFHGSLFGHIRPQFLDSTDFFARGAAANLPAASDNGWGASLGGPIWKNHTYFFASFERADIHDSALQLIPVANEATREQPGPYQDIFNAFPQPTGRPLTSTESVGYSPLEKNAGMTSVSLRLDQTIGSHIQLFGRFSYVPSVSTSIELGTAYSAFGWVSATGGANMAFGNWTHEFRFNFSKATSVAAHGPDDTPGLENIVNVLSQDFNPLINGVFYSYGPYWQVTQLSMAGGGQTVFGTGGRNGQHQWTANYLLNRHAAHQDIRFGGDYVNLAPSYEVYNESLAITSPGIDALLAGVPLGLTFSYTDGPLRKSQHWSSFLQDTFHLRGGLDLLLGARWEFATSPYDNNGQPIDYPYIGYWTGIGSKPVALSYSDGLTAVKWPVRFNQIAPRIGIAYHLHRPDIMIRAGAGIFYDTQMGSIIANENPLNTWQYLPASSNPLPSTEAYSATSANLYLPRVLEWRTTLEKSIHENSALSLSYVGSAGRHLLRNEATIDPQSSILQNIGFTSNGKSGYHALLAQYRGNITPHLYTLISYTWSHSIDTGSSDTEPFLVDPAHPNASDRGSSSFDVRHVFTASLGYNIGKWNISGTLFARTGFPFDVTTVDRSLGLGFDNSGRASLVPGQPVWIGGSLNPAAFTAPLTGQNGTLGRNVLTGPGLFQIDASVRRQFRLFNTISAEASLSAFNLLNHPAFASPVSYLGSALFGQSTSTANLMLGSGSPTTGLTPLYQAGGPRTVELGLRLTF